MAVKSSLARYWAIRRRMCSRATLTTLASYSTPSSAKKSSADDARFNRSSTPADGWSATEVPIILNSPLGLPGSAGTGRILVFALEAIFIAQAPLQMREPRFEKFDTVQHGGDRLADRIRHQMVIEIDP